MKWVDIYLLPLLNPEKSFLSSLAMSESGHLWKTTDLDLILPLRGQGSGQREKGSLVIHCEVFHKKSIFDPEYLMYAFRIK